MTYSGHMMNDLHARVDNVLAIHGTSKQQSCSSQFANAAHELLPCSGQAVTFCRDCGRVLCLNCAEKFLMETYCYYCAEQQKKSLVR